MLTDSDFAYEYTPMVSPRVSPRDERRRRRSEDVGHRTWTLEEVNRKTIKYSRGSLLLGGKWIFMMVKGERGFWDTPQIPGTASKSLLRPLQ